MEDFEANISDVKVNEHFDASDHVYRILIQAFSKYTGREYLNFVVKFMADILKCKYAFVTHSTDQPITRFKTEAYWSDGKIEDNFEYDVEGTPCQLIAIDKVPIFYPRKLMEQFPKEAKYGYESYHAVPLLNEEGQVMGHLGVAHDKAMPINEQYKRETLLRILAMKVETELHRMKHDHKVEEYLDKIESQKKRLQAANKKLKVIDQEKNRYIKALSHDLRAPLNQINGLTNLIKMSGRELNDDQNNCLDRITKLTNRSHQMICNILDIGHIESQKLKLELARFDINNLVNEVILGNKHTAEDKGIKLIVDVENTVGMSITTDRNYLHQILENLLSNAIKFSPIRKKVILRTALYGDKVIFKVIDNGPGINEEDQNNLFKEFQKLSARPTAGEQSIGLGLSITKSFTEALGGKLWYKDNPEGGAIFNLFLKNE